MNGICRLLIYIYIQFFPKGVYNMKKGLDENKVAVLTGKAIQDDNVFLVGFKDFFFTDIGTVKQCQYRHEKSTDAKEAIPGICIFF